jgi:arginine/serine-rich splicing factor 1/9
MIVHNMPRTGSWQDLKDYMREAGEVVYADVVGGRGIVEFAREDDMIWALKNFDNRRFRSHLLLG